jgi:hypothetical protein
MNCATHNDVAAVAYCRTCGKPLCATCTRSVHGVIYCESCLAARLETGAGAPLAPPMPGTGPVVTGPNPALAGILSIFPGVGAVYAGQYAKGLAHMIIFALLIAAQTVVHGAFAHVVVAFSIAFFYVYQIVDAVHSAKAVQMGQPAPDPLGITRSFGSAGVRMDTSRVPTGAIVLIVLGFLFLLNTTFDWDVGRFWPLFLIALGAWLFAKRWGLGGTPTGACMCERCRARGIMGPAIILIVGVLMLLANVTPFGFDRTWPLMLIVIGLVKVFQGHASTTGHIETGPVVGEVSPPPPQPPSSEVNHG